MRKRRMAESSLWNKRRLITLLEFHHKSSGILRSAGIEPYKNMSPDPPVNNANLSADERVYNLKIYNLAGEA